MRGVVRIGLVVLGLLAGRLDAAADTCAGRDDVRIELTSAVDRGVVARGVSFRAEVTLYAAPVTSCTEERLARVFSAASFPAAAGAELVRVDTLRRQVRGDDSLRVLVLERTFVFRPNRLGRLVLPPFTLSAGGRTYRTRPHEIHVYAVESVFYRRTRSIFPIIVEVEDAARGHRYRRVGSAYLARPDAVVTAFHVLVDARRVWVVLPGGRRERIRRAWVVDAVNDVAVLHLDPERTAGLEPLRTVPLREGAFVYGRAADSVRVVYTFGWPANGRRSTAGLYYPRLTLGPEHRTWVSTNAVRPGDSGGPLVDGAGRVVGVVSSGTMSSRQDDVLAEEICIATDPRPALEETRRRRSPRSLRRVLHDPDFVQRPHVRVVRLSAQLLYRWANEARLSKELAALDAALAADRPRDPGLYYLRATLHQQLHSRIDLAAAYEAVLETFDAYFPAYYMLGRLALRRADYDEATRFFERTRRYAPYRHVAAFGLAHAHIGRLEYEEALPYLDEVIHFDPAFAPALYARGASLLALGDLVGARIAAVRLQAVDPGRAARLRQALRYPALRPIAIEPMPRARLR